LTVSNVSHWCQLAATVDLNTGLVSHASATGSPLTAELSKTFGTSPSTAPGVQRQVDTTFSEFAHQITAGLNFSISGTPYWTEDICGYHPNGDWSTAANNELFTRWFEKASSTRSSTSTARAAASSTAASGARKQRPRCCRATSSGTG
jgi:Glycosyl hydrolases family 31